MVHWRLNELIFDDRLDESIDIVNSFKDSYDIIDNSFLSKKPIMVNENAIISFTSINDALKNPNLGTPHLYYNRSTYNVSSWLPYIKGALNYNSIFLPFKMLDNLIDINLYNGCDVFVRPDSGNKLFTGCVVPYLYIKNKKVCSYMNDYNNFNINKDTMCSISTKKNISNQEFRFWVIEGEIVTYSSYSHDEKKSFTEPDEELINWVSERIFDINRPDVAYVIDVVKCNNAMYKIVELNAFSTSGIYNCDIEKLFNTIRKVAIREFNGEVFL